MFQRTSTGNVELATPAVPAPSSTMMSDQAGLTRIPLCSRNGPSEKISSGTRTSVSVPSGEPGLRSWTVVTPVLLVVIAYEARSPL